MNSIDSFILDIIAKLNTQLSKRAIDGDLKTLDNTMYVKVLAKLSKSLASRELKKQLKGLDNLYVNVGIKTDKGEKAKIQKSIQILQQSISDIEIGLKASKEQQRKLSAQIESIRNNAQKRVNSKPLEFNLQLKKDKLISDIEYTGKRFSKLFSSDSATKKYEAMMQRALAVTDRGQLSDARAELAAFTSELKATDLASKSMGDRWRDLTARAKDLFSAASIVRVAFGQMKEAVSTTIDLDKVYTDLIKVQSELTRNDYPDYLEQCNRKAQELATTQKSLIEGAAEFSKSGYNLETSNKLTEKSTVLSNVGEMSAPDSAKAIISSVQAYDVVDGYTDVADKAQALIDKYNELGNTASITTAELAQGVQSVGSVFADANTSVDEFLALLSSGNRQYQNADTLALALRTSALRIRGASVELEEAGEDIEGVMSTLDNQKAIKALTGVDILEEDQKTIRSIYDIFLDISKVYKDMSDVDQSALLDILAGKHRASAISATLNNMTEAETILQNSLNAAGSAQREYDAYLESTEAHLQQFQAKLVETYSTFMDGDMVSHVADIGTALLNLVNSTDLLKHSLVAIAAIKIGQGIAAIGGAISGTVTQMNTLGNALQKVRELPIDSEARLDALTQLGESTKLLTDKNLKLLLSKKQLGEQDRLDILQARNLTKEQAKEKLETLGLTNATNTNTAANTANAASNTANAASVKNLKGAFLGLKASIQEAWAAMSTLQKASIIFAAVSTLWSITSSAMSGLNQSLDETRQKAKELGDSMNSTKSEIEDYKTKIEELYAVINNSGSSMEDVTEARKNLMSIQDELIDKFGAEKGAVDLVTEAVNGQTDAFDKLAQKQWQETKNEFNDIGFGKKAQNFFDGYKDNIARMLDEYGNYTATIDLSKYGGTLSTKGYEDFKQTLIDDFGAEIGDAGSEYLELAGNASEVHQKIMEIQTLLSGSDNFRPDDSFDAYLGKLSNAAKEMSNQYKEMYDNYVLYEEILKNNDYKDSFQDITDAYEAFQNASVTGDENAIANATENYVNIISSAMENAFANGDTDVVSYFESMYPEMQSVTERWEFKAKVLPDFDLSKLKGKTGNEILEMLQTKGIQEGEESFHALLDKAAEYGMVTGSNSEKVGQLLDLLAEWKVLQREITEEADAQNVPHSTRFRSLWDSEDFASAKEELSKLSKEAGITENDIISLTRENSSLASVLDSTGISSQFAAACFQRVCDGADGFSAITDDALALDQVLHEMDGKLQEVTASKEKYDKAMEGKDYNSDFLDYQEDYKEAMEMFENGEYGKHFRAAMERFLGKESYTMGIEELKKAMDGLNDLFGENATNGLEFLERLYEKRDQLEGMKSSITREDGRYQFHFDTDEYEKIGEITGITAEQVAALSHAIGMFGDYASYDIDKLNQKLKEMDLAVKDGTDSMLSLQTVQAMLAEQGYDDYSIFKIMEEIQGMEGIKLIDFAKDDEESIKSIISYLKELDMIELDGNSINLDGLVTNLSDSLRMSEEQIETFIQNLNKDYKFTDAEGNILSLDEALKKVMEKKDNPIPAEMDETKSHIESADEKAKEFSDTLDEFNKKSFAPLRSELGQVTTVLSEMAGLLNTIVEKTMEGLNNAGIKPSTPKVSKPGQKNGTGRVKASGDPGIKKDETALINEIGEETIIDPKEGTYEIVHGGAQFRKLKRGQIVLNHLQTESLLKNGKISSFGKMLFRGTAGLKGNAYNSGTAGTVNPATKKPWNNTKKKKPGNNSNSASSSNSNSSSGSNSNGGTDNAKESIEVFDFIETAISRIEEAIDRLKAKAGETFQTFASRGKEYRKSISKITEEIHLQEKAYEAYLARADSVGLEEEWASQVRDGKVNIADIADDGLKERIKDYQKWWIHATLSSNG